MRVAFSGLSSTYDEIPCITSKFIVPFEVPRGFIKRRNLSVRGYLMACMNRIFFNETSLIGQNLIIQQKLQLIDYKISRDFTNVYKLTTNLKDKNIFLKKTLLNNMYSIFYTFSITKLIDIYQWLDNQSKYLIKYRNN